MAFMLLSYLALPTQKTRSHYLSVCLIVAVSMIAVGFIIPLATKPEQCYNQITPNDMYSSTECAWSGAFVIAGGLSAGSWILIRALSMNLQICWDIVPGRKFFWISQALGWGIPAALFTVTMVLTGVGFRFGEVCLVNHQNSTADFWGPLLACAAAAGSLQLMTFVYCLRVYLKNLFADQGQTSSSGSASLPAYSTSIRTQTARAVWRRLQKVLWLQWRGICIVTIILVDVVFFSIIFVRLDAFQHSLRSDLAKVEVWLVCLVSHPTDKDSCRPLIEKDIVKESTVVAVLLLLALTGVQVFVFLTRPSVFPAWITFLRNTFGSRSEFVSLDAKPDMMRSQSKQGMISYTRGHESTTFEMQSPGPNELTRLALDSKGSDSTYVDNISSPEKAYHSPRSPDDNHRSSLIGRGRIPDDYMSFVSPDLGINGGRNSPSITSPGSPPTPVVRYDAVSMNRQNADYFSATRSALDAHQARRISSSHSATSERRYHPPSNSFSAPNVPSRQGSLRSITYDQRDIHSRGGLALNPPSEIGESDEDLPLRHVHYER